MIAYSHRSLQTADALADDMLECFDAALRTSTSATATLADWLSGRRGLHVAPAIFVCVRTGDRPPPSRDTLDRLGVADASCVAYRRVWLAHEGQVLSRAENWYVPGRLTTDMNESLKRGKVPFGAVIASLGPTRETLSADRLWELTFGQMAAAQRLPPYLLRHRALLRLASGVPISEVDEVYTRNIVIR